MASQTTNRTAHRAVLGLRAVGALALIAMAALHLQQYYDAGYSAIPTIGTLFVLNFVGGVAPKTIVLGHGDEDSRLWFEEQIRARYPKTQVIQATPGLSVQV